MKLSQLIAIPLLCTSLCAAAQSSLLDAPTTFTSGDWSVRRQVDAMTDAVRCTGIYKGEPMVQVSSQGFYIRIRGGIQSVTLRFDNDPPQQMRLPTRMEKQVSAIILEGAEYEKALASKRLRYESLLLIRGMASGDVSLEGLQEAVEHIKAGCPT